MENMEAHGTITGSEGEIRSFREHLTAACNFSVLCVITA